MKREERTTLNALRKSINPGTINVEVPTTYTKEGRQEIHHMLTLEKGFIAVRIYWNPVTESTAVHYIPAADFQKDIRMKQETADIDELTATLPDASDWTWNGYRRPGTEETAEPTNTTDTETKEDEPMNNVKINLSNGTMTIDSETFTFDGENWIEDEKEDEPMNATTIISMTNELIDVRKGATRSAWNRGLTAYAHELVDGLDEAISGGYFDPDDLAAPRLVERAMLNGADDWSMYSWGGCSLIYDPQIAERLCTASELKQTRNGERNPNSRERWLDVQARALYQAAQIVKDCISEVMYLVK